MAIKQGDKVKYIHPATGRERSGGVVHGVRKAETDKGERIISYLIDTGAENPEHEGREDRQPELVDIKPGDVQPA